MKWFCLGVLPWIAAGWAQEEGPKKNGERPGPFGLPSVGTLKKELKLTPKQVPQVAKIYQEYQPKREGGGPGGDGSGGGAGQKPSKLGEGGGKMQELRAEAIAKITAILTEEQKTLFLKLLEKTTKGQKKGPGAGPK